jgi:hypothetical protein
MVHKSRSRFTLWGAVFIVIVYLLWFYFSSAQDNKKHYTSHVGVKFYPDGRPRYFPGNTIICNIRENMPQYSALVKSMVQMTNHLNYLKKNRKF